MREYLTRSEAADYFAQFKSSIGGSLFTGRLGFFVSDKMFGVVQVQGDSIDNVLFAPVNGFVDYIDYDIRSLYKRRGVISRRNYKNYFYIERNILKEFLAPFKIRQKKKSDIIMTCTDGVISLEMIESDCVIKQMSFDIKLYNEHKWISFSDFNIKLPAYEFDMLVFYAFDECVRIGVKFNDKNSIIFFNQNKLQSKKLWEIHQ